MKNFFYLLLLLPFTANASFNAALEQKEGWETLPRNRPFPLLWADPREIKTALRKNSRGELEADVGTYRSFMGKKTGDRVLHFGLEGNGYFIMQRADSRFPLISSDGLIGLYLEGSKGETAWQVRYTHISAHLSDDGIASGRNVIQYSREFLSLRVARQLINARSFYYLGYRYLAHTIPALPRHGAQIGVQSLLPAINARLAPFVAAEYALRNAHEGSTWVASTGLALLSSQTPAAPPLRLSFNYLSGHDPRGQFFGDRRKKFSVGLELDL